MNENIHISVRHLKSFEKIAERKTSQQVTRWLAAMFFFFFILLFFPWTQNIQSNGIVTAINPGARPQTIHSTIAGRIEKWHVQEGQAVKAGDTIAFISEIKDQFFDPQLIERAHEQMKAKEATVISYQEKVQALERQIAALDENLRLKISQMENRVIQATVKVESDSIELQAALTNFEIADKQFKRQQELFQQGLVSLTQLEQRELRFQEAVAKRISAENRLISSRNDLINARIELNSIRAEFSDKIAKARSDRASSLSEQLEAEAGVIRLRNQIANFTVRFGFYYITAPQDCYINKVLVSGVGETVKEGQPIVGITPLTEDLGVELFVRPMDLPLIKKGGKVRLLFDGWPAFFFSGWPGISFGTYGGVIVAAEQNISPNGKYRILVGPDKDDEPWPLIIRMGSGAFGMSLLNNVPVWYEIWRQINGFPPEYYIVEEMDKTSGK